MLSLAFWIIVSPLIFTITDIVYATVRNGSVSYVLTNMVENVQMHLLKKVMEFLTLLLLTPLYLMAQANKWVAMDASIWACLGVIVLYDFLYYWYHIALHKGRFLWGFHSVHHQPEQLDSSMALRGSFVSPVIAWTLGLPMIFIGFPAESILLAFAIHALYQIPCHNQWFPRIAWLEWLFITPSLHRAHHGMNQPYLDRNFGNMLSIWDRMFGTLQVETDVPVKVGIKESYPNNMLVATFSSWMMMYNKNKHYHYQALPMRPVLLLHLLNVAGLVMLYVVYGQDKLALTLGVLASVLFYLIAQELAGKSSTEAVVE